MLDGRPPGDRARSRPTPSILDSPAIHYGSREDALPTIGDVQVRNRGTVGGAVAHADPGLGPAGGR